MGQSLLAALPPPKVQGDIAWEMFVIHARVYDLQRIVDFQSLIDLMNVMSLLLSTQQVTLGKETSSNSIRLDLSDVAW